MGMFDYIKFECEVPVEMRDIDEWQTKNFDNEMETYTITAEGKLVHHTTITEVVPEAERPYPNEKGIKALFGMLRRVPAGDVVLDDYHGYVWVIGGKLPNFVEARVCFTHGKMESIEVRRLSHASPTRPARSTGRARRRRLRR